MPGRERSIAELMGDLARESSDLIRKEIELAKLETNEKLADLKIGLASLAVGAMIAFAGLLVLLQAATEGLDREIQSPWLSALLVGGVTLVIGVIVLVVGRSRVRTDKLAPERTMDSLRRDQQTVARHMSAG